LTLPATSYDRIKPKGAVAEISPDDKIIRFCQIPPKPTPALLAEMVALPNVGKSTTIHLVGKRLAKAGYLVYIMNNSALPIFRELKGLGDGVPLLPQSRLVQYAAIFRVVASEVRKLRPRFNVILVEHFCAFFRAFESSGAAGPESTRIVENALRGVRRADLTFYLAAPPSLAVARNKGSLTEESFIRMYRSLESLAKPEAWHRVPVLGRGEDDIAEECFRVIADRLNARFYTRAARAAK
jgi:thymidylate kinase